MTPIRKRIAVATGLSIYFLIVYGTSEAIAASRTGIPSVYYAWERHVPFVAVAIIPYLSIDVLFFIAPLLLRTDQQLKVHALRVTAAVGFAAIIFVLFPLKFAFSRPAVPGSFGTLAQLFWRADLPVNQLPSLHIALLLIVGDVILRRVRGIARALLMIWLGLIAASPLLIYQHHLVDLIAGFALGLVCLALIREDNPRSTFERNYRVASYYFIGGLLISLICIRVGKMSWPLWWPALSLLIVAIGYCFIGPWLYAKRDGRLPWTSRVLFWPTLLGQHISLIFYARQCRPYDAVTDRLWIGRKPSEKQAAHAAAGGVGAVVDLTSEFNAPASFQALHYLSLPTLDLTAPTQEQIQRGVDFIAAHEKTSIVYIHCKAGYSRTAVVAAAYLIATNRAASPREAIELLQRVRPKLIVRPEARKAIERFGAISSISPPLCGVKAPQSGGLM